MAGPVTRWGLLLSVVLVAGICLAFDRKQDRGGMGGRMSPPKALWLAWAILYWLFVCPLLAFEPTVGARMRWVLGIFAAQFWVRALVELYMLYGPKNWKPPYGIAHDVFSAALVAGLALAGPGEAGGILGVVAVGTLFSSLCVETYYAVAFHHAVEGHTTGEDGLWFAGDEERFRRIVRITTVINVPLFGALGWIIARAWGLV